MAARRANIRRVDKAEDPPIRWTSYENIHKHLNTVVKSPSSALEAQCFVTLKLDGSNLAVQMRRIQDGGKWQLESLPGRNKAIWTRDEDPKEEKLLSLSYGNAGKLDRLPLFMSQFVESFANSMSIDHIVVYGEAFRYPGQQYASWHPFGYKLPDEEFQTFLLNSSLHAQFLCHSVGVDRITMQSLGNTSTQAGSGDADYDPVMHCFNLLLARGSTDHVVFPPPAVFQGSLAGCIDTLFSLMRDPPVPEFEGVFITMPGEQSPESNQIVAASPSELTVTCDVAVKWKTGKHESQMHIASTLAVADDTNISPEQAAAAQESYGKLKIVYANRTRAVLTTATTISLDKGNVDSEVNLNEPQAKLKEVSTTDSNLKLVADNSDSRKESSVRLRSELSAALTHELSKWPPLHTFRSRKQRAAQVVVWAANTVVELKSRYDGMPLPMGWGEAQVSSMALDVAQQLFPKSKPENTAEGGAALAVHSNHGTAIIVSRTLFGNKSKVANVSESCDVMATSNSLSRSDNVDYSSASKLSASNSDGKKESSARLRSELSEALAHELSKWPPVSTFTRKQRAAHLEVWATNAVTELKSRYDGMPLPMGWGEAQMSGMALDVVQQVLNKLKPETTAVGAIPVVMVDKPIPNPNSNKGTVIIVSRTFFGNKVTKASEMGAKKASSTSSSSTSDSGSNDPSSKSKTGVKVTAKSIRSDKALFASDSSKAASEQAAPSGLKRPSTVDQNNATGRIIVSDGNIKLGPGRLDGKKESSARMRIELTDALTQVLSKWPPLSTFTRKQRAALLAVWAANAVTELKSCYQSLSISLPMGWGEAQMSGMALDVVQQEILRRS